MSTSRRALASVVVVALAAAVVTVALPACPKAGTDKATTATASPSPPWWMSVKDGKLHRGLDEAPIGLYAAGDMQPHADGGPADTGRFVPGGDIEGDGPIGADGQKAWLDLATGTIIVDGEPRPPAPYVEGAMTRSGFSPASRKIHY